MKKITISKIALITVLGTSLGYALYTFRKEKKLKAERINKMVDEYINRESDYFEEEKEDSYKREYIYLGSVGPNKK